MRAAKVDENQAKIVSDLRALGISVVPGHDDCLVGYKLKTYWFEIKRPDEVSKKTGEINESKIKPSQKSLRASFKGHYSIVWSTEQILLEIGYLDAST